MATGDVFKSITGGTVVLPTDTIKPLKIRGGRRSIVMSNVTGPDNLGSTAYCPGNDTYAYDVIGIHVEGPGSETNIATTSVGPHPCTLILGEGTQISGSAFVTNIRTSTDYETGAVVAARMNLLFTGSVTESASTGP